jgi:hypothetical protein
VFVTNTGDGYLCGQAGRPQVARRILVSLPYPSLALAHDNLMHRQHMPLTERQHGEIEVLECTYASGGRKGTARNQAFFDALRENRWAAGETRPGQACHIAVLAVISPPRMEPKLLERAVGVGGQARPARPHEGAPPLGECGDQACTPRKKAQGHDRT